MFAVKNIKENYVLTYECFGGCGANQFDVRKFTTKEDAERSIKFFCDEGYWNKSHFDFIQV